MKLKLDENLPLRAVLELEVLGADVDTAASEGLSGADDGVVLRAATHSRRLLLTLDRGFGDVRVYPPGSHHGVLVLRTEDQAPGAVAEVLREFVRTQDLDELQGAVAVYHHGSLRVRRATARD